jgi:hypothetical protein
VVALPLFLAEIGGALDGGFAWAAHMIGQELGDIVDVVLHVHELMGGRAVSNFDHNYASGQRGGELLRPVGVGRAGESSLDKVRVFSWVTFTPHKLIVASIILLVVVFL